MKKSFFIPACVLAAVAVFFLVQSILTLTPDGESNWYLSLVLGLNCIALLLNAIQRRKQQKKEKAKE